MKHCFIFMMIILILPVYSFAATGSIEIYSEPSGAKVYIDDAYIGRTPYKNSEVPAGNHKIKVELNKDYPSQSWDVFIDPINPLVRTFNFKSGSRGAIKGTEMEQADGEYTGNVQFVSIPSGAMVLLNGERQNKTPLLYTDLPAGKYSVEFKAGEKSLKGDFEIKKNKTVKLIADFSKGEIINKSVMDRRKPQKEN
jgi:hypothetical protein